MDARDGQLGCRVAEERRAQRAHRGAGVHHDALRDGQRQLVVDEQRDGPARDGVAGEVVAVEPAAADAHEQGARLHGVRAVGDVRDLDRTFAGDEARAGGGEERSQLHEGRV